MRSLVTQRARLSSIYLERSLFLKESIIRQGSHLSNAKFTIIKKHALLIKTFLSNGRGLTNEAECLTLWEMLICVAGGEAS